MAIKSWDPSGTPGTQLVDTPGRPAELANVVNTTGTQLQYDATAGADRGSNIGIHATATAAADNASMRMDNTQLAWGSARCYARFRAWPSVATDTFGLRSSAGNAIRFFIGTTGLLTIQNNAGTNIGGFSQQLTLNTWYRLSLQAAPGTTTTTGTGAAQLYDNDGVLIAEMASASNLNMGTTANILSARMGKNGTAGTFDADFTQLALDTSATTLGPLSGVAANSTPLAATVTVVPVTGQGAHTITVTINSTGGTGTTKQHTLTWGDGTPQVGPQTSNVFTKTTTATPGTYTGTWSVVNT